MQGCISTKRSCWSWSHSIFIPHRSVLYDETCSVTMFFFLILHSSYWPTIIDILFFQVTLVFPNKSNSYAYDGCRGPHISRQLCHTSLVVLEEETEYIAYCEVVSRTYSLHSRLSSGERFIMPRKNPFDECETFTWDWLELLMGTMASLWKNWQSLNETS